MEVANGDSMLDNFKADVEQSWAGRLWYGSVFGAWCIVGAGGVVVSFIKSGAFRFLVPACYFSVFVLALHSFLIAMSTHPPTKKLSLRMSFLAVLTCLPWIARPFLE
jgi:hypothetical protein